MYQFSNEKIFFHTDKLLGVLDGECVDPSVYEVSLSGHCNARCAYCCCRDFHNSDNLGSDDIWLLCEQLVENRACAVVLTGGGEPMLNPLFLDAVRRFHGVGLSVGVITNGLCLREDMANSLARSLKFLRVSLDSVDPVRYREIRGGSIDFRRLLRALCALAEAKHSTDSVIQIGAQIVLLDQDVADLQRTIEFCKKANCDFIQIRPVDNRPGFKMERPYDFYQNMKALLEDLRDYYSDESFRVVINLNKFEEYYEGDVTKCYPHCYGANFTASIGHDMNLYFCCTHIGNPDFSLGNLRESSLSTLLRSKKRQDLIDHPHFERCQMQCRNHKLNQIINDLFQQPKEKARENIIDRAKGNPPDHVEFL